jgi:hypothetical protein
VNRASAFNVHGTFDCTSKDHTSSYELLTLDAFYTPIQTVLWIFLEPAPVKRSSDKYEACRQIHSQCGLLAATALWSSSAGPAPTELTALTRKTYWTPSSSPEILPDVTPAPKVPAGCHDILNASRFSTMYCVMLLPPSSFGGIQFKVTLSSVTDVTWRSRGAPGLSAEKPNETPYNVYVDY